MNLNSMEDCERALQAFVPPPRSQRRTYDLKNVTAFMDFIRNPQDTVQVIHVAGTSGKTSTCYYIAALLEQAGLKTGLTVSPHITKVSERIQINLTPITDEEFSSSLGEFLSFVKDSGIELTYFEILITFAYWYFAREKVDVAVIETGIGGLLDGSNIVSSESKICVLTDIGLDHTAVLGKTIPEIASQKAGIIHHKNEVFCWNQSEEIMTVFSGAAKNQQAKLHAIEEEHHALPKLMPLFQKRNFSLAIKACEWVLINRFGKSLSEDLIISASEQVIPARMETIEHGDTIITMDGAHNPQKMHALVESYLAIYGDVSPVVLFACMKGPDSKIKQSIAELLRLKPSKIIITEFQSLQDLKKVSTKPSELIEIFNDAGFMNVSVELNPHKAVEELKKISTHLLITGSLYLIFEVRSSVLAES